MWDLMQLCLFIYLAALGFLRLRRFYTMPLTELFQRNSSAELPDRDENSELTKSLSIIVPARNEERRLSGLLQSLKVQTLRPHEIIVVDDGSSDGTAELALNFGCRLLQLPKTGWSGKSAACFAGAQAATGEVLVFFDADVELSSDALEYLAHYYQKGTVLSVQPYHRMEKIYEQASLYFNLVAILGLGLGRWKHPFTTKLGFFGPCMVIDRETYLATGGHRLVGDSILEDMALGQAFAKLKILLRSIPHTGRIRFRMYPEGFQKLFDGWSKNMALGAQRSSLWTILIISAIMALSFSIPIGLFRGFVESNIGMEIFYEVAYFAFAALLYFAARRIGSFRFVSCLSFPVLALFFVVVLVRSFLIQILRLPVDWRGRKVQIK